MWLADTKDRLNQWHFNSLAPWACYSNNDEYDENSPPLVDEFRMPYTLNLDVCKDLTDVFSDEFDSTLRTRIMDYIIPEKIEISQFEKDILDKITDGADREFMLECYNIKDNQTDYILKTKLKKNDKDNKIKDRISDVFKSVGYTPARISDPNLIGYYYVGEYDWASIGYNDEGINCLDLFYRYFDLNDYKAGKKELISFLKDFYHGNIYQFKYEMGLYINISLFFTRIPVYDCYPQITSFEDLLNYYPTTVPPIAVDNKNKYIPMSLFTLALSDLMPGMQDVYQDLTDMLDDFMNMRLDKIGGYAPDFLSTYNGFKTLVKALHHVTGSEYIPQCLDKCDEVFEASGFYNFMEHLNAAKEEAKAAMNAQWENITNIDRQINNAVAGINDAINRIEEIEDKIDDIKDEIEKRVDDIKDYIEDKIGKIPKELKNKLNDILDALGAPEELKDLINNIFDDFPKPDDVKKMLDKFEDKMKDLADKIDDLRPEKKAKRQLVENLTHLKSELEAQRKPIRDFIDQLQVLHQQINDNLGLTKYVEEIKREIGKFMKMLEFPDVRKAWTKYVADHYFEKCHAGIKKVDQNHLILGSQFIAWCTPQDVVESLSRYTDVVSVNHYNLALGLAQGDPLQQIVDTVSKVFDFVRFGNFDEFYTLSGKPLLIGEFCFVADENLSGCPNSHMRPLPRLKTQTERAAAFATQAEEYLKFDYFIGYHWWKYIDCPPGGRKQEGEDFNAGLVSINDEIYTELTSEMERINGKALDFTRHRLPIYNKAVISVLKPIIQQ